MVISCFLIPANIRRRKVGPKPLIGLLSSGPPSSSRRMRRWMWGVWRGGLQRGYGRIARVSLSLALRRLLRSIRHAP